MSTQFLPHALERTSAEHPDAPAISLSQSTHSYSALHEAVCRLRGSLSALGIRKGDNVCILLPNSPHFVIAHYAVMGLGAVSVPINIQHKAREIGWQLEDSEARAIITWSNFEQQAERAVDLSSSTAIRIYLGDSIPVGAHSLVDLMTHGDLIASDPSISEHDTAALLYTAGTSGHPRGIELTHGNLLYQVTELANLLKVRSDDKMLGVLPFSTAIGLSTCVHLSLLKGANLVVQCRFHAGDSLEAMHESKITMFAGQPWMLSLMTNFPATDKYNLSECRFFISSGSKLASELASRIVELFKVPVYEAYGVTETSGIVAINAFPGLTDAGSVGQPLSGMEISVFSDNGKPQPPREIGGIAVRGPAVMKGYRHRPERARSFLEEGWVLTGDEGYLDEESQLTVTGHSGDLIVKGGFSVHPREVEEVIEGLPHVAKVAVVSYPDPVYGDEIKACVVLKDGASIGPTEILEYVKERIALYKCPKLIKFYRELPETPDGRIKRAELRKDSSRTNDS